MAVPLRESATGAGAVRSVYRAWVPPGPLACVVDRLWVGEPGWPRAIRVLPDGCVDLVWTGATVTVFPARAQVGWAELPARRQVGARLRCGVAGDLLGVDCASLGAGPVPLADLVAAPARRAEDELARAGTPGAERAALARLVGALARRAGGFDPVVPAAARLLGAPDARVDGVAERLGVSPRALRRRVRAAVGMGPKELHRVLRLRRIVRALPCLADDRLGLAALAAELGYADQAHLGRECRRLTGSTPAALVRRWRRAETFQTSPRPGGTLDARDRHER